MEGSKLFDRYLTSERKTRRKEKGMDWKYIQLEKDLIRSQVRAEEVSTFPCWISRRQGSTGAREKD